VRQGLYRKSVLVREKEREKFIDHMQGTEGR
jgi:hypothetical protein